MRQILAVGIRLLHSYSHITTSLLGEDASTAPLPTAATSTGADSTAPTAAAAKKWAENYLGSTVWRDGPWVRSPFLPLLFFSFFPSHLFSFSTVPRWHLRPPLSRPRTLPRGRSTVRSARWVPGQRPRAREDLEGAGRDGVVGAVEAVLAGEEPADVCWVLVGHREEEGRREGGEEGRFSSLCLFSL
jgi:hypothetical protein